MLTEVCVGVRCSMENLVVACVGALCRTNKTRMLEWIEDRLVRM